VSAYDPLRTVNVGDVYRPRHPLAKARTVLDVAMRSPGMDFLSPVPIAKTDRDSCWVACGWLLTSCERIGPCGEPRGPEFDESCNRPAGHRGLHQSRCCTWGVPESLREEEQG
jgi:hypothetical protein